MIIRIAFFWVEEYDYVFSSSHDDILYPEGTQKAHSRYLFALSCFEMDLLNEAKAALCPPDEPSAEVLTYPYSSQ